MFKSLREYKQWRIEIFVRDNYTCQECFQHGGKLQAHHVIPASVLIKEFFSIHDQFCPIEDRETLIRLAIKHNPFWDIKNGITLCYACHKKTKSYARNLVYIEKRC